MQPRVSCVELLIAANPDTASSLPYLMRLPLSGGMVFRVRDTWPRTKAIYCHLVDAGEWPEDPEIVVREPLRSCERRGGAIDVVLTRARENRSQVVFTKARGREMVFWQSPKTRKQARPDVRQPTGVAAGSTELTLVIDSHERYPYRFGDKAVTTIRRALPAGDYGALVEDQLVAAVERKSAEDLLSSLTNGKLRFALGELAALPRAAVVVEDRYSAILKSRWVRPAAAADGIAELQVRWPTIPIVFCETRAMAEEYTYRFLSAATMLALDERGVEERLGMEFPMVKRQPRAVAGTTASSAEVRRWAQLTGLPVSDRGKLKAEIIAAYVDAHPTTG